MPGRKSKAIAPSTRRGAKQRQAGARPQAAVPQSPGIASQNPDTGLPLLRNSERSAAKRCEFAWWLTYQRLRKPLSEAPALRYGSLIHGALAAHYVPGIKRGENPVIAFERLYEADLKVNRELFGMKVDEDEKWVDAAELGVAMLTNYLEEYGTDDQWEVLVTEWPFQYPVYKPESYDPNYPPEAQATAVHWFNAVGVVDGAWRDRRDKSVWIPDHKTAAALGRNDTKLRYLQQDDQAGMYWSYGVKALKAAGLLKKDQKLHGMLYNFLRKAMPDERPSKIVKGQRLYLNKDGTVSQKQPSPYFRRIPIFRDEPDKFEAERRIAVDFRRLEMFRSGALELSKTPGQFTCPMCSVRDACELHEVGQDWEEFLVATTKVWDPYAEHEIYDGR